MNVGAVRSISPSNIWTELYSAVCAGEKGEQFIAAGSTSQVLTCSRAYIHFSSVSPMSSVIQ